MEMSVDECDCVCVCVWAEDYIITYMHRHNVPPGICQGEHYICTYTCRCWLVYGIRFICLFLSSFPPLSFLSFTLCPPPLPLYTINLQIDATAELQSLIDSDGFDFRFSCGYNKPTRKI